MLSLVIFLTFFVCLAAGQQNLIKNGDFSQNPIFGISNSLPGWGLVKQV